MDGVIANRARVLGITFEAMRDEYLKNISLRRMAGVDDIANLALLLASDLAGDITGQAIPVNGNTE
jgi:enoyl-[acyl-carrier-protein] reductase (NADH)